MWITISIVVFFTILIVISFYSTRITSANKRTSKWPPTINKCPDYWEYNGVKCIPNTVNKSATTGCSEINPYLKIGGSTTDELTNTAKNCGIVWDGINNSYPEQ